MKTKNITSNKNELKIFFFNEFFCLEKLLINETHVYRMSHLTSADDGKLSPMNEIKEITSSEFAENFLLKISLYDTEQ